MHNTVTFVYLPIEPGTLSFVVPSWPKTSANLRRRVSANLKLLTTALHSARDLLLSQVASKLTTQRVRARTARAEQDREKQKQNLGLQDAY